MRTTTLFIFFFCLLSYISAAKNQSKIASVPFEVVGSYAVVEISINGSPKLNFILDSGVSNTIITELHHEDSVELKFAGYIPIRGLGLGSGVQAQSSHGNTFQAGKMTLVNQTVVFLEEDIFNLSKHVGSKINGILGSDFFENHIVKIDYNSQRITFYENESFIAPKKYTPIPMIIEGSKMFVTLPVTEIDWSTRNAKMLLDTGAELTAWFRSYGDHPIEIPAKKIRSYIGQGLSGEIKGYMGRIYMMNMGGHPLYHPIVHFPDSAAIMEAILVAEREGTIGSQILSRFNLIFDQSRKRLYIKPNHHFKRPFSYNIAGIELILDDPDIPLPEISQIRENSPAEHAGLQVGDKIFQINELSGIKTNINVLKSYFEISSRSPLRLTILRGDRTLHFKVEMKGFL
ncbi:MAG: aspartyl protease family protein [Bacteroidales bacterium]|nr:aspartyl protease family protein [Bacteroidales bacterium]